MSSVPETSLNNKNMSLFNQKTAVEGGNGYLGYLLDLQKRNLKMYANLGRIKPEGGENEKFIKVDVDVSCCKALKKTKKKKLAAC